MISKCLICNIDFKHKPSQKSKYCSQNCYHKREIKRKGIELFCKVCNKKFYVKPCYIGKSRYCSKPCFYSDKKNYPSKLRGRKLSLEVCNKISISTKKAMANLSPEKRAKLSPKGEHRSTATEFKKGFKHTEEKKLYQSKIAKERGFGKWMIGRIPPFITQGKHNHPSGENHKNWQGGKSFEPYPLGWTKTYKEQIRNRDGYKCKLCGVPEIECSSKLDVHHIDYNKNNVVAENLISLCKSCHTKTNFNREFWGGKFTITLPLLLI